MKRITMVFGLLFGGLALFLAGFFSRQPKINKLKKHIKYLQKEIKKLEELRENQNKTINNLLIEYKALKVYSFAKRLRKRDRIKSELVFQYGTKEYLQLLLDQNKKQKLTKDEVAFFYAFDSVIEGKQVSNKDQKIINAFIIKNHQKEIELLTPCDYEDLLLQIKNLP